MFFIFLILWLIFSLKINVEIAAVGTVVSIAAYWFARKHLRHKTAADRKILKNMRHGLRYIAILIYEIAKANVIMFRIVFSRNPEIKPRLIFFKTNLKTGAARVVLANSITLTPGTITVALNDDVFCIHCLNEKMADGIEESVFVRQLRKFEE